jgi:ATP dependent DNA ligase-like protein
LRQRAPAGEGWVYEIKADGYRAQLHLEIGNATVCSRTGLNWTKPAWMRAKLLDQAMIGKLSLIVHLKNRRLAMVPAKVGDAPVERSEQLIVPGIFLQASLETDFVMSSPPTIPSIPRRGMWFVFSQLPWITV